MGRVLVMGKAEVAGGGGVVVVPGSSQLLAPGSLRLFSLCLDSLYL